MATKESKTNIPGDLFDPASFATLSGSVLMTWIATNAIADLWNGIEPKLLGLIIAFIVALLGFFISEKQSLKSLATVPFNALLVYLTIVGGTSFLPTGLPPVGNEPNVNEQVESIPADTADATIQPTNVGTHFFTQWNPNRALVDQIIETKKEKQEVVEENGKLTKMNSAYRATLDSTRVIIRQFQIRPEVRRNLLNSLRINENIDFKPVKN